MTDVSYIVQLEERRSTQLTGRPGLSYQSPPHALEHAHQLASALLDCPPEQIHGEGPWSRAIAGGERTVTILVADRLFDPGP
jgi:hypothetical protein